MFHEHFSFWLLMYLLYMYSDFSHPQLRNIRNVTLVFPHWNSFLSSPLMLKTWQFGNVCSYRSDLGSLEYVFRGKLFSLHYPYFSSCFFPGRSELPGTHIIPSFRSQNWLGFPMLSLQPPPLSRLFPLST